MNDSECVALMEQAVIAAGRYLTDRLKSPEKVEVWRKADNSLVMELDLEAERRISEVLAPVAPLVCEEADETHSLLTTASKFWLVDPVDGTSSCEKFLRGEGRETGFGPLVGWIEDGRAHACCFYHIPEDTLYTALLGEGAWSLRDALSQLTLPPLEHRVRLGANCPVDLAHASVLFYPGKLGESALVAKLKAAHPAIEARHLGGFASDCARVASGREQLQCQFSVKPWDYTVTLLAKEAGLRVLFDPMGAAQYFEKWQVQRNNPVLIYPPSMENVLPSTLFAHS